jgi:hypothetical protein
MKRSSIVLTGLIGLVAAFILTTFCLMIMTRDWIPAVLSSNPRLVWGFFLFLAFFSVVEIPVMILGMRRLAASSNPRSKYVVLLTNAGYSFFAAVYAASFILLTGYLRAGVALAVLSVVRLISAIIFLPTEK